MSLNLANISRYGKTKFKNIFLVSVIYKNIKTIQTTSKKAMYSTNFDLYQDLNSLGIFWQHHLTKEGVIEISEDSKKWLDNNYPNWEN